jgi:hypothetical protein
MYCKSTHVKIQVPILPVLPWPCCPKHTEHVHNNTPFARLTKADADKVHHAFPYPLRHRLAPGVHVLLRHNRWRMMNDLLGKGCRLHIPWVSHRRQQLRCIVRICGRMSWDICMQTGKRSLSFWEAAAMLGLLHEDLLCLWVPSCFLCTLHMSCLGRCNAATMREV